ncbi:thiosulfate dehydrogenase [quinone] large subunit [Isoptericola jiangsuensis]|uniref:Thiosulfate dehydrogenase [quinone] large subunit n=1 Tax=Isoptericola jiangsuensis TaxID=548579 RepID=A0A2A9EXT1_9MICO|nr:DoxX family protein [Isoptericola jiangsuensis]PFG43864.1 thiosulfate dehydrogenase [quinone] large subunit [Isoptericola jiangsuensis]
MTSTTKEPRTENTATTPTDQPVTSTAARRALALCRLALGAVFLWPALDKIFGLGYATTPDRAWIAGGSPTSGYLGSIDTPPAAFFAALAGPVTDVLFVGGMLGTGLALLLGIGLRVAAVAGGLIMAMLYVASWPFAPGSNNPLVDDHLVYVALLAALALTRAGDTWGLGRVWAASGVPGTTTWMR